MAIPPIPPMQKKKASPIVVYGGGFLLLLIVFVIGANVYLFPRPEVRPPRPDTSAARIRTGSHGMLVNGAKLVAVGRDSKTYDRFQKLALAKDTIGIAGQALAGEVYMVDANTKVLVIDINVFNSEVRILQGNHIGKSGIVPTEFIKP